MKYRGYARISLDNERSGSIAKQKQQISGSVIAKGGDPEEIDWYVDESKSGAIPLRERPDGKRLWGDITKGDVVLVSKLDRAGRSVSDLLATIQHVEKAGASIVFVGNDFDTSTPTGRLLLVILAAVAEFERALIAERRRESIVSSRIEGRTIVGAAPFGFASVQNPSGRGLAIRPDWTPAEELGEKAPAAVLREAIERVLSGESYTDIIEELCLPLKKAGLSVLLRNPRLAGMTPDGDGVVMVNGVPRIDADAALLSMAEWNRLREHMQKPEKKPWAHQDGFGAVLHCSVCGMRLYKSSGGPKRPNNNAYKCGRAKHTKGDPSVSVQVARADAYLEKVFLGNWSHEPEMEQVVEDDEAARTEAIALAIVHLEAAKAAQDAAETDDDEEEAFRQYRAAKRALKVAEELPLDRRVTTRPTGRTYGEAWALAADAERCHLIAMCLGPATVIGGQRPIEQKVTWPS